jgi:predicted nucleotidyltransferase
LYVETKPISQVHARGFEKSRDNLASEGKNVPKKKPDGLNLASELARIFLRAAEPGLVSAYLFGSMADDRAHRESDIDVGVLLRRDIYPTARERFEERLRLSARLGNELKNDAVDLVILNDAPPHLGRKIVTTGKRLFCSDEEADHAFVRDVQLRAADLEPFLRRARRVKLAAIAR